MRAAPAGSAGRRRPRVKEKEVARDEIEVLPASTRVDPSVFDVENLLGVRLRRADRCAAGRHPQRRDVNPARADGLAVDEGNRAGGGVAGGKHAHPPASGRGGGAVGFRDRVRRVLAIRRRIDDQQSPGWSLVTRNEWNTPAGT